MTTRLRNAYLVGKSDVSMRHTNFLESIARVLKEEKYIKDLEVKKQASGRQDLVLSLSYVGDKPAVTHIKRISKPGVRMYTKTTGIRPVLSGMGIAVLSTSKGVMTDRAAKKAKLGGEVLFELW